MSVGALALVAITLAGCGSQSANQSSNSSVKNASSQTAQSNTNSVTTNSSTSATPTVKVDDKTAGVMLALLVEPDWLKEGVSSGDMYYGVHGQDGEEGFESMNGWSYITENGDPTSYIHYKVNGDTVTYRYVDVSGGKSVAESPMVTKTVSLSRLEKDYYVTQSQKDEVNGYVSKLQPESAYLNSIKNNDQDDDEDDDD